MKGAYLVCLRVCLTVNIKQTGLFSFSILEECDIISITNIAEEVIPVPCSHYVHDLLFK